MPLLKDVEDVSQQPADWALLNCVEEIFVFCATTHATNSQDSARLLNRSPSRFLRDHRSSAGQLLACPVQRWAWLVQRWTYPV